MRSIYVIIFILMSGILSLAGQNQDSIKYHSLKPSDFHLQYLLTDSSILIDVREPFEFKGSRIKNAINIPASGNIDKAADSINKQFSLFLYCTSGFRSSRAAGKFYEKGFRKLYNLKGGITAWRKDGMPVQKGRIRKERK